jgi:CubicO group peptidase (beta-lactamase class C family)
MKLIVSMLLVAALIAENANATSPLPQATPEDVGMSSELLKRVDDFISRLQTEGKVAGAVTVVARRGRLVSMKAHGLADIESKRPIQADDIFGLASMTKPIIAVATMMLVEEGRILLGDPLEKYLPEFHDMKVAVVKADAPDGYELVPAKRAITIHDLLTHRAGFAGVPPTRRPAEKLSREVMSQLPADGDYTLEDCVRLYATAPLDAQPGEEFRYGAAMIVMGRVIEVVSGQTLDVFLRERIFEPLGMNDTGFRVPEEKSHRVVTNYAKSPDVGLVARPRDSLNPKFLSGGGNLFSTPGDYLRFCQMLLNGGELDGRRLLGRKSVELMTANHVDVLTIPFMPGNHFGLGGFSVQNATGASGLLGSPGMYGWSGALNTYFRVDPKEKLIFLLFVQLSPPTNLELTYGFHNVVMQAIVD